MGSALQRQNWSVKWDRGAALGGCTVPTEKGVGREGAFQNTECDGCCTASIARMLEKAEKISLPSLLQ